MGQQQVRNPPTHLKGKEANLALPPQGFPAAKWLSRDVFLQGHPQRHRGHRNWDPRGTSYIYSQQSWEHHPHSTVFIGMKDVKTRGALKLGAPKFQKRLSAGSVWREGLAPCNKALQGHCMKFGGWNLSHMFMENPGTFRGAKAMGNLPRETAVELTQERGHLCWGHQEGRTGHPRLLGPREQAHRPNHMGYRFWCLLCWMSRLFCPHP